MLSKNILYTILAAGLMWACTATESSTETVETTYQPGSFSNYINSLPQLNLPLAINSESESFPEPPAGFDTLGFQRYKSQYTVQPVGVVYTNDDYYAVLEYGVGDYSAIPQLMVYNREGVKLDSLNPYKVSGHDMGYHANETVEFSPSSRIKVTANIVRLDIKDDDEVAGSEKKETKITTYQISDKGKISSVN